jgi:c-di-GMP-binding flagellar brake protein YcgR
MQQDKFDRTIEDSESQFAVTRAISERAIVRLFIHPNIAPLHANFVGILHDQLLIDNLEPKKRIRELAKELQIEAHFWLERLGYCTFPTHFLGKVGTSEQYLLQSTKTIRVIQRRDACRVIPAKTLPAECLNLNNKPCEEKTIVENVSITGVCLSFVKSPTIRIGAILPKIQLLLNQQDYITLHGAVRAKYRGAGGRYFLGLEWLNVDAVQLKTIQNYVFGCQRRELQQRH